MTPNHDRILAFIDSCDDPKKLKILVENADAQDAPNVAEAARRRLFSVQASERQGSLEFDVWQSIYALEEALSTERKKTTRLARTRQKIGRVGERQTVIDLVKGAPSSGFTMLIERSWPELTFEALALKHFDDNEVKSLAVARLESAGIDVEKLLISLRS